MDLTNELPKFNMFSNSPDLYQDQNVAASKINGSFVNKAILRTDVLLWQIK